MKRVECVEKLLLRALFSYNKLNIIDQKHIDAPVLLAELGCGIVVFVSDCIDQFVRELLGGHVHDLGVWVILQNKVCDRVHQMRFAESNTSINEKRVVDLSRGFCNGKGCRVC